MFDSCRRPALSCTARAQSLLAPISHLKLCPPCVRTSLRLAAALTVGAELLRDLLCLRLPAERERGPAITSRNRGRPDRLAALAPTQVLGPNKSHKSDGFNTGLSLSRFRRRRRRRSRAESAVAFVKSCG